MLTTLFNSYRSASPGCLSHCSLRSNLQAYSLPLPSQAPSLWLTEILICARVFVRYVICVCAHLHKQHSAINFCVFFFFSLGTMFLRSKCVAKPASSPLLPVPAQSTGFCHLDHLFFSPTPGKDTGRPLGPKQHKMCSCALSLANI